MLRKRSRAPSRGMDRAADIGSHEGRAVRRR